MADAPDGPRDADDPDAGDTGGSGGVRSGGDVVVPLRLYKTVTVFSTLIAVVAVVVGFVVLDSATRRGAADAEEVNVLLAFLGLALIVFGAAVYAFSTRFRAEGMGTDKGGEDERPGNG